jgi:hypothetical protein
MVNLLTQKISKEWSKLRALDYTDRIYLDDKRLIYMKFNQVKPMILRALQNHTPKAIEDWLGDIAIYFGKQDDIKNRNIWLDLYECYMLLQENKLLPIHNGQLK